jgi:transcriptional regulator with XRE-family HTH domain
MLADRLKAARDIRGLSQKELARKVGFPASSISHFEAGSRKPSLENFRSLAEALAVNADFLLGRISSPIGEQSLIDPLYRTLQQLSAEDRDLVEDFVHMLKMRGNDRR